MLNNIDLGDLLLNQSEINNFEESASLSVDPVLIKNIENFFPGGRG